jgi:hypothetical protein
MKFLIGYLLGSITVAAGLFALQSLKNDDIQISLPSTAEEVFLKIESEPGVTQFSIICDSEKLFDSRIISNAFYIMVDGDNGFNEIVLEEHEQEGVFTRTVRSNLLKPSNSVNWKTVLYDPELGKIVETIISTEEGVYIIDSEGNKTLVDSEPIAGGDATR